ncbi:hypothetical protein AB4501_07405 [Vibrio sp. 10N.222.55.E8]|uniref:hypothetical protein n=1 Tax=Vibrio sp. 10N.261.51.C6 TaxID=3229676 RepID=UPI00354E9645
MSESRTPQQNELMDKYYRPVNGSQQRSYEARTDLESHMMNIISKLEYSIDLFDDAIFTATEELESMDMDGQRKEDLLEVLHLLECDKGDFENQKICIERGMEELRDRFEVETD